MIKFLDTVLSGIQCMIGLHEGEEGPATKESYAWMHNDCRYSCMRQVRQQKCRHCGMTRRHYTEVCVNRN